MTFFAWDLYVLETFSIVKIVLNYLRETYFCLPRILFLYLFHDSLNFFYPYCAILPWFPGDVVFFILVWLLKSIDLYLWLAWVFVAVHGFSLVMARRGSPHCGALASHCDGFLCSGAQALGGWASAVGACGLCRFSS